MAQQRNDSQIVESILTALERRPRIHLAVLFGSVAAGRARADSDLDLAVKAECPLTAAEKMSLVEALADATGRPVDLIDLATVGEPLLGQILAHGKRIYGEDADYARLILQHVYAEADFLPYRDRIIRERRAKWIAD